MEPRSSETKECDVLVIGGGGSGALACVEASENDHLKIILASKGPVGRSGLTPTANGGTRAAGGETLFKEMVTGGRFLNDQDILWFMLNEIGHSLDRLRQFGVKVAPLSERSVCVPGPEALKRLRTVLLGRSNVVLAEDVLITRLLKSDRRICGATALDLATGEFFTIRANAVVLATGGLIGELYPHSSNNPFGVSTDSSGTGHVMAYQAGAELIDMEMIQFVPLPADPRCLHLRYFPDFWMGPYENRLGEVIESDVASYPGDSYSYLFIQNVCREIEKGNGPISIDQRDLKRPDESPIVQTWEQRKKLIKKLGIDPSENRIEIVLGSHFCMGGIRVNRKTETTLPGLFAAGEVMGGVHGAMRLSGCSFTQMIVFGLEAGKQAALFAVKEGKPGGCLAAETDHERQRIRRFLEPKRNSLSLHEIKRRLQKVMEEHVFVFRGKAGLTEAIRQIGEIRNEMSRLSVPDFRRYNLDWARSIEASLTIDAAEIAARSALAREESRGSHHRIDFPEEDHRGPRHTVAVLEGGRLKMDSVPAVMDRMRPMA